jgi:hypothetical protein
MDLTLPLGGSRGTSGEGLEGLIFQLIPSRTILPEQSTTVYPSVPRRSFSAILPEEG